MLRKRSAKKPDVGGNVCLEHPDVYSSKADFRIEAKLLRKQITSRAGDPFRASLPASQIPWRAVWRG
jgi:hypothetical protein